MADLRERLKALVEEMESEALRLRDVRNYSGSVIGPWARKLAAILAESESDKTYVGTMYAPGDRWVEHATRTEPKSLPLGHEFKLDVLGLYPDKCHELVARQLCGQPRSVHRAKED